MNIYMSQQVNKLKDEYPPGTRIELIHMDDEYTNLKAGDQGTVRLVDSAQQIHVNWDNGSSLALIPDVDEFKKV